MKNDIFTGIVTFIFLTGLFVCYTLFIAKMTEKVIRLQTSLADTCRELIRVIAKGVSNIMNTKGDGDLSKEMLYNHKSLSELLVETTNEKDYTDFINGITAIVKDLYSNYQFLRQDPAKDDFQSGYFLAFQIIRGEYPVEFENLFRLAIDKGLDMVKLNKLFVEQVVNGNVLDLGECVVDPAGTGLSSILQADTVRVNVTFAPKEYAEKKQQELDKLKEQSEKRLAEQKELAEQKDRALVSVRLATALLDELVDEIAEKHELTELVEKIKESMGYL